VLRILIAFKNPSPRPGLNPRTLSPVASTLNTTPPEDDNHIPQRTQARNEHCTTYNTAILIMKADVPTDAARSGIRGHPSFLPARINSRLNSLSLKLMNHKSPCASLPDSLTLARYSPVFRPRLSVLTSVTNRMPLRTLLTLISVKDL
jgi:hypothetical protein